MDGDKSFKTIYPAYINSNRTKVQGRRISKSKAVADPKWQEIKDVLEANGNFEVKPEPNKLYTRELDKEAPVNRGRVKYRLTSDPNGPFNKKQSILLYLAETIPKLKSRSKAAGTGGNASNPSDAQTGGNKKKKGKK